MKYDPVSRLRDHINSLVDVHPTDPSSTLEIFRKTRLLLENARVADNYPALKLYCDWCVHSNLDRKIAWSVLAAVDKVVVDLGANRTDAFTPALTEAMLVGKLRTDFIALYKRNNIKTFPFDSSANWQLLLSHLFDDLQDRPIGFDTSPFAEQAPGAKKAISTMIDYRMTNGRPGRSAVKRIFVTKRRREGQVHETFFWNVRMVEDSSEHCAELEVPVVLTVLHNDS